jgi:hypothetical protein
VWTQVLNTVTPKNPFFLKRDSEVYEPQFSKLEPANKMAQQADSSNFFHPENINIDEKLYDDPIQIIPPHLGSLLVPKILY